MFVGESSKPLKQSIITVQTSKRRKYGHLAEDVTPLIVTASGGVSDVSKAWLKEHKLTSLAPAICCSILKEGVKNCLAYQGIQV
ncbi:hypothetical protein GEMRC1_013839 [Eukaryota sp. GEM-RC1]